jgi:hypothetical protein
MTGPYQPGRLHSPQSSRSAHGVRRPEPVTREQRESYRQSSDRMHWAHPAHQVQLTAGLLGGAAERAVPML